MIEIPLATVPNQSFSIRLSDHFYELVIKETNGCMSVTIFRDNVLILENIRAVAGTPIIPYHYLESGNFIFSTENDDLPDYSQFGISQSLIYATQAEIGALRAGT
jgi:hypothetical protein